MMSFILSLFLFLFLGGNDYTSHSLQLNFIRTTSHTVTVDITTDSLLEFDETFFGHLTLVPTTLNVMVNPNRATITVQDDDGKSTCFYKATSLTCSPAWPCK